MNKGKEMKRAVLYLRVSKNEQTIENQRIELERVALAKGWKVIKIRWIDINRGDDANPIYRSPSSRQGDQQ